MSIKVELIRHKEEGGTVELICPKFYCDWCDKVIDGNGVAMSDLPSSDSPQQVYHAHKGDCHTKQEATTKAVWWTELAEHAQMLACNVPEHDGPHAPAEPSDR